MVILDIHTHNLAQEYSIYDCGSDYTHDRIVSVGIHPWKITDAWEDVFRRIEKTALSPNVAAIGECGIDKVNSTVEIGTQKNVFKAHALLAERTGKPLIIHCVKGFDEIIAVHKELSPKQTWILHGFRGKPQQAQQLLNNGICLSFGEHFNHDTAKIVPLHSLFIESDESLQPISTIMTAIAQSKEISTDVLAEHIKKNTRIFGQF